MSEMRLANPEGVKVVLTTTFTIGEWRQIAAALEYYSGRDTDGPAWYFRESIRAAIQRFDREVIGIPEHAK